MTHRQLDNADWSSRVVVSVPAGRMSVRVEGHGPAVVLLHGNPTSSFLYRDVVPPLLEAGLRVIVPDLPGFGQSSKITHANDFTVAHHVADLTAMIDQLELSDLTLVCHDWGGPVGLSWAVEHRERVRALVVMSTWAWTDTAPFHARMFPWRMMHAPLVGPYLMGRHNALAARGMYLSVVDRDEFRDGPMATYRDLLPDTDSRLLTWQYPRMIPLAGAGPAAAHLDWLEGELRGWDVPALIVWGREDDVFPASFAHRFRELLPNALGPEWVTGRHFLQEDSGAEIGRIIARFLVGAGMGTAP